MSVDGLFDVKNSFYLGNYQQCINEAQKLTTKSEDEKIEKESFMYRAYIALGKSSIPLSEIPESTSSVAFKAVRRFAEFQNERKRAKVIADVEEEVSSGSFVADDTACVLAANILNHNMNYEDALRVLHKSNSLEARALSVHSLLKMDRPDLAVKELKKMNEMDEDATLTQLALAWVNMAVGKDKLNDAFYIFQEMMDKYGQTVLLMVGQASVLIMQEKYEDAEKLLKEAQEKDGGNAEMLVSLIVVSGQLNRGDVIVNRLIEEMKGSHADHPWTKDLLAKEMAFDRAFGVESSA